MRRRDFFRGMLGVVGAVGLLAIEMRGDVVSGDDAELNAAPICPDCGMVMLYNSKAKSFECLTGTIYAESTNVVLRPACRRFGIKYQAPKMKLERAN